MTQFRIALAKIQSSEDSKASERRKNRRRRAIQQQHGFVEMRGAESPFHARDLGERRDQICGALHARLRHGLQALRSEKTHVNRRCRYHQSLVGTDVRGRFAASYVLLTRL